MAYTNSPLVVYTKLSPNHSGLRNHAIDTITPHCVVGQCSVESLGNVFAPVSRQASCQYGIGSDGRIAMYCEEKNRSWCTSSGANDNRAVTIECASDATHPYAFKDVVYNRLIDLCVDICQRNGKNVLLWFGDKNKTLNYTPKSNEMLLTVHRWFAAKSCPGDWMYARMGDLATKVTERLGGASAPIQSQPTPEPVQPINTNDNLYYVQVGAYSKLSNANNMLEKVKQLGFKDAFIKQINDLYKVQLGAFSKKENAEALLKQAKAKGLSAFIAQGTKNNKSNTIKVGSNVKINKGAKTYTGGSLASYVYGYTLQVKEINGDRVVVTYNGITIAAMKLSDLTLV